MENENKRKDSVLLYQKKSKSNVYIGLNTNLSVLRVRRYDHKFASNIILNHRYLY